jgi:predicted nucleotidyltransferase
MTPFTPAQVNVLRSLVRLWTPERFVVIGASALACFMDMRWRMTQDLDLSLAAPLHGYAAGLESLPGWSPDRLMEHHWHAPGDVRVDIVPADADLLRKGELVWPKSGQRMSLVGFRLAFNQSVPLPAAPDLSVRVAPTPVVLLLKMVAYLDRPGERERDLEDIGYILEEFVGGAPPDRFSDEVLERGLAYEEVSPFLLGRKVSAIINHAEREVVVRFLGAIEDENNPTGAQALMVRLGPPAWRRDPAELLRRLDALKRGFAER